jgi:hypothetical protein
MGADKGGKTHGIGLGKEKAAPTPPGSNRHATTCIAAARHPIMLFQQLLQSIEKNNDAPNQNGYAA